MTIGNALNFIKQGMNDELLRKQLNTTYGSGAIEKVLAQKSLIFSLNEFDEAFHQRLVQCQEASEAEQLKEFRLWWTLLTQMDQ